MTDTTQDRREGSLDAPTRHPLDWQSPGFYDRAALEQELERVYDICHGCRRCVSLCNAFPKLFDLVDESETMEIDGVQTRDYYKVVEHCYLCDLCYMTKCPYVPPHEWNVDFPHLMLRAKAVEFKAGHTRFRDKLLTSTDLVGSLAGIPVVADIVNAANRSGPARALLETALGVHRDAILPPYHSDSFRKRYARRTPGALAAEAAGGTRGKVALFVTCYGNRNAPAMVDDLVAVLEHNGIPVTLASREKCCGMPKLELGDLDTVAAHKQVNIPELARLVDEGWDLMAPVPSCVLMYKQELPLMFPDDADVAKVRDAFFDPFEYLMLRHKAGKLDTSFSNPLGKVSWHVPCHQRVQNIGPKTREVFALVPDTTIDTIERCSGHDGTYAVKREYHEISMKIGRPVANKVREAACDHYMSDCPMAGDQIHNGLGGDKAPESPFTLLRHAYGI
ncbi:MAG: Fe-S oxidoreductase [Gammaproteobacteria bacterium]|nr:Fe-S oxidoreductase [Gammaproteobacteria bacterium]